MACGVVPRTQPAPPVLFAPTLVVPARPAPTPAVDDASVVGLDAFRRATGAAWSAADRGGAYTLVGPETDFGIAPGVGTIRNPAPGDLRAASLLDIRARDVDMSLRLETDRPATGGDQDVSLILRRIDDQNYYFGRVRFDPDGTAWLQAARTTGGSQTLLGTETQVPGYVHAAGIRVWVRAEAMGSNPTMVRMKAWPSADSEPQAWSYAADDSAPALQMPGAVMIQTYVSDQVTNAPVTFGFSDLRVLAQATPTLTPTPATNVAPATNVTPVAPALVVATPTSTAAPPTPGPSPTPSATEAWSDLTPRLDAVWATDPEASVALLDQFQVRFPDFQPARDKLYAALIARSQQLVADDQLEAADAVLQQALQLFPDREEARAASEALTPSPTPAPPTPTPPRISVPAAPVAPARAPTPRPAAPVIRPTPAPAIPTKAPFVPPARP
jgi:hypothetical protein